MEEAELVEWSVATRGCLDIGSNIVVSGLVNSPELNGLRGSVLGICADTARGKVKLENGKLAKVKASNIEPRPNSDSRARAQGQ